MHVTAARDHERQTTDLRGKDTMDGSGVNCGQIRVRDHPSSTSVDVGEQKYGNIDLISYVRTYVLPSL